MIEPSQSFVVSVPSSFDLRQRNNVGRDVVALVRSRTRKGLSINNVPFSILKPYSKEYVKSLDFKNAGKTSKVDLTLTGEMLNLLTVLGTGSGWVKIGFDDRDENNKASWNRIHGRRFMGIADSDLRVIIDRYSRDDANLISDVSRAVGEEMAIALLRSEDGDT